MATNTTCLTDTKIVVASTVSNDVHVVLDAAISYLGTSASEVSVINSTENSGIKKYLGSAKRLSRYVTKLTSLTLKDYVNRSHALYILCEYTKTCTKLAYIKYTITTGDKSDTFTGILVRTEDEQTLFDAMVTRSLVCEEWDGLVGKRYEYPHLFSGKEPLRGSLTTLEGITYTVNMYGSDIDDDPTTTISVSIDDSDYGYETYYKYFDNEDDAYAMISSLEQIDEDSTLHSVCADLIADDFSTLC